MRILDDSRTTFVEQWCYKFNWKIFSAWKILSGKDLLFLFLLNFWNWWSVKYEWNIEWFRIMKFYLYEESIDVYLIEVKKYCK